MRRGRRFLYTMHNRFPLITIAHGTLCGHQNSENFAIFTKSCGFWYVCMCVCVCVCVCVCACVYVQCFRKDGIAVYNTRQVTERRRLLPIVVLLTFSNYISWCYYYFLRSSN